jgi:hypothetical protein
MLLAVLARFALIVFAGLPLTSSSPRDEVPTPGPTPLQVEVVGDDFGAWVALAAALVGAVAAIASWRAATAAKKAAKTGENAAEHAATAANAAQKTAEYERATFNFMVDQERQRQALGVLVSWGGDFSSQYNVGGVHVLVENTSGTRITELQVWAARSGRRITEVKTMQDLGNASQSFALGGTAEWFDTLGSGNGKGVVRFTDAVGIRWERRSGEAPITVDSKSPEP